MNIFKVNTLQFQLLFAMLMVTVSGFFSISEQTMLPVHFDISGNADWLLPRNQALAILPAVALFLAFLPRLLKRFASAEVLRGGQYVLQATLSIAIIVLIALQSAIIAIGNGYDVDVIRLTTFLIAFLYIILGNALPKSQPNGVAGIRLPWTLRNAENWQVTHRFGGMCFLVAGVCLLSCAIFTDHKIILLSALIAGAVIPLMSTIAFSYKMSIKN